MRRTDRQLIEEGIDGFEAEIEDLRAKLKEQTSIVSRIWELFGNPSCQSLNGRTIVDLIEDLQRQRFQGRTESE